MKHLIGHANKNYWIAFVLAILLTAFATASVIYLTPLRHFILTPGVMNEMDPKAFYAADTAHPNQYMLIDVRSSNVYLAAHAKGAINIPIENLYDDASSLPRSGVQIALICTTGRLAAVAYGYLEDLGFTNLIHIQGGLVNWTSEGLPVEGNNITEGLSTSTPDEHQ